MTAGVLQFVHGKLSAPRPRASDPATTIPAFAAILSADRGALSLSDRHFGADPGGIRRTVGSRGAEETNY
jgi:hypothetical protein